MLSTHWYKSLPWSFIYEREREKAREREREYIRTPWGPSGVLSTVLCRLAAVSSICFWNPINKSFPKHCGWNDKLEVCLKSISVTVRKYTSWIVRLWNWQGATNTVTRFKNCDVSGMEVIRQPRVNWVMHLVCLLRNRLIWPRNLWTSCSTCFKISSN